MSGFGWKDKEAHSFRKNPTTDKWEKCVADADSHDKLDTIAGALGVSNTTATIFNLTIAVASTEQSQALPANTKKFIIRTRGKGKLQLAYSSGDSGTTYITVPAGASYEDINLYTSQTLYFQSPKVGEIVELIAFT